MFVYFLSIDLPFGVRSNLGPDFFGIIFSSLSDDLKYQNEEKFAMQLSKYIRRKEEKKTENQQ